MHRVEETQEPEANNELLAIGGRGWTSPLCTQQCPRPQDTQKPPGTGLQLASDSGLVLLREVGRHALALLASRAGTHHRVNLAFATHTVEIHPRCCTACASPRPCVRPTRKRGRPQFSPALTSAPYTRFFLQSLSTFAADFDCVPPACPRSRAELAKGRLKLSGEHTHPPPMIFCLPLPSRLARARASARSMLRPGESPSPTLCACRPFGSHHAAR